MKSGLNVRSDVVGIPSNDNNCAGVVADDCVDCDDDADEDVDDDEEDDGGDDSEWRENGHDGGDGKWLCEASANKQVKCLVAREAEAVENDGAW